MLAYFLYMGLLSLVLLMWLIFALREPSAGDPPK
jgi:hypothetical protein